MKRLERTTREITEDTSILYYTIGPKVYENIPWEERDPNEAKRWLVKKIGTLVKARKYCRKGTKKSPKAKNL